MRRQRAGVERGALHAPDARLQFAHDVGGAGGAFLEYVARVQPLIDPQGDGCCRGRGRHPSSLERVFECVKSADAPAPCCHAR